MLLTRLTIRSAPVDDAPELLAPAPALAPPRLLLVALAGCLLLQAVTLARQAPPAVRPASAPADEFSAERAAAQLARVLGDEAPHPLGTPANAAVRERLLVELRGLGCAPEVQTAWTWAGGRARGAFVRNVIARLPSAAPTTGQPLLLLCHYDSVPAGPGASDDGMGVAAVLEAARALLAGPPLARPVLLVFTDGEEAGLLGARAFVRDRRLSGGVGAVVNVEARGTSGPSYMFQTSPGNAWMVPLLAGLPRPACSSLFPAIYEVLPNDTDLTVFLEEDPDAPPGLNFACIGDVDRYHTPLDDLAHLSRETLQHHGDNLLHLARGLDGVPLETLRTSAERLVYFDLFGWVILRWPEPWSAPLAGLCLVALAACAARLGAARGAGPVKALLGLGAWAAALALSLGLAAGLAALLVKLTGSPTPWAASPLAGHLLFWGAAALGCGAVLGPASARLGGWALWHGGWLGWSALGLGLALALPGACFTFVAPALVAAALGALAAWRPESGRLRHAAWLAPLLAGAALWLPLARGFEEALGLQLKLPVTFAAALVVALLAPLLPPTRRGRWGGLVAGGALALAALTIVLASGPHSPERPQRVNCLHEEEVDPAGGLRAARWVVETRGGAAPPLVMIGALRLGESGGRWSTPAAPEGFPAPELTVLSREGGRVRLRLRSPRGGWALSLQLDRLVGAASIEGVRIAPVGRQSSLDLLGLPPEGVELDLELEGGSGPVRFTLRDAAFGLPPSAAPLAQARPDWAVRSQQGDGTIVIRTGSF